MTRIEKAVLAGCAAAVALIAMPHNAVADTVVGSWENLVTPPPPDPSPLPQFYRRPIGSSGTEGWVDFDNRNIYTSDTYGATLGSRSVKVQTVDDGGSRYSQGLTLELHTQGLIDNFLTSGQFAVDVSWKHSDWVGGNWSGVDGLVINASNPGFQNVGRATMDSARPDPNDQFKGFWDAVNWGDNTRTLTWDLRSFVDGDTSNEELTVVQGNNGGFFNLVLITNYDNAFNPATAAFYFDNARFLPRVVTSEWKGGAVDPDNNAGNGNAATGLWHASTNWTMGVPGTADSGAIFATNNGALIGAQSITLDQPAALGSATFNNPAGYTIAGTGSLTMDVSTGSAAINVLAGSHTVGVPLVLADDATVDVASSSSLNLAGALTAAGRTITKNGGGTLQARTLRDAGLNINGGAVRLAADGTNAGTSKLTALNIAGSTGAWSGALDVNNNALVIDYSTATPIATVADQITSGYAGGSWNGNGINSTAAATTTGTGVGFAEASELGLTSFAGQAVDSTAVLVRYTRLGDANLDGTTNIGDFSLLGANFNQPGNWSKGDFNYDGVVNIGDFSLLAANFNQSVAATMPRSAVPEPATLGLLGLGLLVLRRRRC